MRSFPPAERSRERVCRTYLILSLVPQLGDIVDPRSSPLHLSNSITDILHLRNLLERTSRAHCSTEHSPSEVWHPSKRVSEPDCRNGWVDEEKSRQVQSPIFLVGARMLCNPVSTDVTARARSCVAHLLARRRNIRTEIRKKLHKTHASSNELDLLQCPTPSNA